MRESLKGQNHRLLHDINIELALLDIWRFGWLRAPELGALIWPKATHFAKQGQRLARQLVDYGLVIARSLPSQQGRAFVLSEAGAARVRQAGWDFQDKWLMAAKSGKDWGKTQGELWEPPASWRHDLIATSLLCRLYQAGFDVMPERQIKGEVEVWDKYPDGLMRINGVTAWLEVEQARKSGAQMAFMAKHSYLASVAKLKAIAGAEWRPSMSAIAYPSVVDERGHVINHRARIVNALSKVADRSFKVWLLSLKMAPGCYAVDSFKAEEVVIQPAKPTP